MNILISKSVGGCGQGKGRPRQRSGSGQRSKPRPRPRKPSLLDLRTHPLFDLHPPAGDADQPEGRRAKHPPLPGLPPLPPGRTPLYRHAQVSFTDVGGYTTSKTRKPISLLPVPKAEISQLRTLDKDCFIIPVASLDRFLPAGVPMPLLEKDEQRGVSVVEVDDPKICLLIHLMTQMEPIEPILESPLSLPHAQQKRAASDLLTEMGGSRSASEGMLLCNIEKNAEFPFISYYVINKSMTDPGEFFHSCRAASLRKFDPRTLRYSAAHTFDLFNEVATIARPPLDPTSKRPTSPSTGFIVSLYKVFEGDDGEKFEKNWLYWTGARMIYRALPKAVGLRRITLHKSVSSGDKLYLLLVECSNFLEQLGSAASLIPALRARLCGYTGLYRTIAVF